MKDLMLDIETMGSNYGSVITQIGACYFDRYTGEIGRTFQINISMKDAVKEGFKIEPGAVIFWLGEKNRSFLTPDLWPIRQALEIYRDFGEKAECVWSHSTFDFSMIQDACHRLGIKNVNPYSSTKDIRTLMELADTHKLDDTPNPENAHDALSDCIYQVKYCVQAFNKIKK